MKIHLAWIRRSAAAAIVAGASVSPAAAQYAPYRPIPQQPAAPVPQPAPRVAAQQPYWQQAAQQAAAPQQVAVGGQYPRTTGAYVPTASAPAAVQYPQYPTGYTATSYPQYPQVAQQPAEQAPAPTTEEMPAPVGTTNGTNGAVNGQVQANGAAVGDYQGYANGHGHYQAGSTYYGNACHDDYGLTDYFGDSCHDSQWFGGMYFLFMERDNASPVKLTVEVDHAVVPDPYYPPGDVTVMSTIETDHEYREGVEVRFGSTFAIMSGCDTCDSGCYNGCNSCQPCTADIYAWEVAWWGLDDSPEDITIVDEIPGDTRRMYGMKNFVGLEYDRDGAGAAYAYVPVNDYYDYQLPIPAPPGVNPDGYTSVLAQRVRTNFRAQNFELNIIRFPVCETSCGGCNTCDSGCYGGCETCNSCEPACVPRAFSMYGSCGVRYFRMDDDFMYANEFREWDDGTGTWDQAAYNGWNYDNSNELYYDVQVDNELIGPQLGWTMNYCYGCKWNFFANSTFGVFNNHIEHMQRLWSYGGGTVRFAGTGEEFYVESDKDDISFLGELRLGGSYDVTCNWRAVAAYRAVAIAGIANSTDQVPSDFTNAEYVAIIDSDSSVIVHGVQVGAECRY
jgi:hypothetical protein